MAALIIGISGACRCEELVLLKVNDVEDHKSFLFIRLPETEKKIERGFTVVGNFYEICKKYIRLRPDDFKTDRFFLNFKKGEYKGTPIGIHALGAMPKEIASFLNLPNPEQITGYTFRRTFPTLPVDVGADITNLKLKDTQKSNSIAESSTKTYLMSKKTIGVQISSISIEKSGAMASTSTSASLQPEPKRLKSPSTNDELSTSWTSCVEPATQIPNKISERIMKLKYPIIVVNTDRTERKTYMTHANVQEAIERANKFSCSGKIILHDEDGSEVCDDDILEYLLQRKAVFMICNVSSDWIPQNTSSIQTTKVIASSRRIFVPELDPSVTHSTATKKDIIRNITYPEFANFSIPWEKVPPFILTLLETGEPLFRDTSVLISFLIDELLLIKQTVPVPVMRKVAEQVISRYPKSFIGHMDKNTSDVIDLFSSSLKHRYFNLKRVKSRNARLKSVNNEKTKLNNLAEHDIDIDVKIEFDSLSSNELN